MQRSAFGVPSEWPRRDLIGVSSEFDEELVLEAYRSGVFPMPSSGLMGWYSPIDRGILPLDGLKISRSLRKTAGRYEIRVDTAFEDVLKACGDPRREGAWIDRSITRVYTELHRRGVVHSVEAWTKDGELAGGLYGVSIGGLFAGESMFHDPVIGRDASKAALIGLVELLRSGGSDRRLLDVQWKTDHLARMGVIEIDRLEYLERLKLALSESPPLWPPRT